MMADKSRYSRLNKVIDKYASRGVKLNVRLLKGDEPGEDLILLEGDSPSLAFLGELLIAQANESDNGFAISPRGAGSAYFTSNAEFGIYLHRKRS